MDDVFVIKNVKGSDADILIENIGTVALVVIENEMD